jgi:hypothetical protein
MATSFAPLCVYTIKQSKDLVEGRKDTFHENKSWTTAKRLLADAERDNESVIIVFAEAEKTDALVAWAVLEDIQITDDGTDYTFSKLARFKKPFRHKSDLRKRDGKPLSKNFIRPYAICRKPKFLG